MNRFERLRSSTFLLGAALFVAAVVWWAARMAALFHLNEGTALAGFWVPYYALAGVLFLWGAYRLWTTDGRVKGITWWMLAAPLTLLVSPFVAAGWLGYLLLEPRTRRRASSAEPA